MRMKDYMVKQNGVLALLKLAIEGITSYTTAPFKDFSVFWLLVSFVAFIT